MLQTVNATLAAQGLLLKEGTAIDATLIAAPSSTKNSTGTRDPEMHQTKKGNPWHFGMKAHIGVDADSGLVHTVVGTPANVNDVTQAHALVHGEESAVFADAGYQGVDKRDDTKAIDTQWHVAMRPGKRRLLEKADPNDAIAEQLEHVKARIRAKVEHPFRVIKRQFGAHEGPLPRTSEEHRPVAHAVRAEQSVDGAPPTDRHHGMSASARRQSAAQCSAKLAAIPNGQALSAPNRGPTVLHAIPSPAVHPFTLFGHDP